MMRWLEYLSLTVVLLTVSVASAATETCDDIPDLRQDSSGWNLSDQELETVNALLDQAEGLCAEGKADEATKLLSEAEHDAVSNWAQERLDTAH
jgi:hypothetical protein